MKLNEELNLMKSLFDYKRGVVISEQEKAELVEPDSSKFITDLSGIDEDISQSDNKNMTYKKNVETFQIGLELLGYDLPSYGVDGLFGLETASSLNRFKSDNDIEVESGSSVFDVKTKDVMVDKIKSENITDEDIKKYILPSKEFTS